MHVLLVGQAPSRVSGPQAFDGLSGDRLARHMGLPDRTRLREVVSCTNLLVRYPGISGKGKGDAFPRGRARAAAQCLLRALPPDDGCLLLLAGHRVAQAFGVNDPYLRWRSLPSGHRCAVVPHPSGINLWWNDAANLQRFRSFVEPLLRRLLSRQETGACSGSLP